MPETADQRDHKEWTVMIYFAGDNNLSEEMIYAIKEMYRVGVTEAVDVIVQFDPSAIGAPVRRYVISQEELAKDVEMPKIKAAIETISKEKAMVASASHSQALGAQFKREPCQGTHPHRKTDAIAGLDIDSNIIEDLGIPLDGRFEGPKSTRAQIAWTFENVGERPKRLNFENSADPQVLAAFISESIRHFPSKKYMVVLSGHGSGALGDFLPDVNPTTGVGPLRSLSIPSLKRVLDEVKAFLNNGKEKIDILGMDSCLMSMAEIGHELKDSVGLLVGSESFVLNIGWPYHRILEALNVNSAIGPANLAEEIVKKYISYYDDYEAAGASTDQSACDLGQFKDVLEPAIRSLAGVLTKGLKHDLIKDAIVLTHWEAQSYKSDQYVDLYDFCDLLAKRCADLQEDASQALNESLKEFLENIKEACNGVKRAIQPKNEQQAHVVLRSCYTGPAFQYSHGLSVYFPWSKSDDLDDYRKLTFASATGWGEFLKEYVGQTLRPARPQPRKRLREGHYNPRNEILETLLQVRSTPTGKPRGGGSVVSMKNPPTSWRSSKCSQLE